MPFMGVIAPCNIYNVEAQRLAGLAGLEAAYPTKCQFDPPAEAPHGLVLSGTRAVCSGCTTTQTSWSRETTGAQRLRQQEAPRSLGQYNGKNSTDLQDSGQSKPNLHPLLQIVTLFRNTLFAVLGLSGDYTPFIGQQLTRKPEHPIINRVSSALLGLEVGWVQRLEWERHVQKCYDLSRWLRLRHQRPVHGPRDQGTKETLPDAMEETLGVELGSRKWVTRFGERPQC